MSKYNLLTLSADKMVENNAYRIIQCDNMNWKVIFQFDLSAQSLDGREIILFEKAHEDNALFYQLKQCLGNNEIKGIDNKNILRQHLIFVDFKKVFSNKTSKILDSQNFDDYTEKNENELKKDEGIGYRLRWMFDPDNGIRLSFDGVTWKTFVPFDKSGNMARSSLISFIDKDLKEKIDKRLLLDLDFTKTNVISSKYYAYRGLYLSTGYRIAQAAAENAGFRLNQETVIVIPDKEQPIPGKIFTAEKTDNDKTKEDILWTFSTKEKEENYLNSFDGEGLICPEYSSCINEQLKSVYHFEKDSHSFQTRMPFTKGVLHEVDFNKFFAEQITAKGDPVPDRLFIYDVFGIKRDLKKAKIILTKSMFKCAGWLEDLMKNIWNVTFFDKFHDPMKYFFDKMAFYDHALYVTNTDARLSSSGKIPMNYQFLSTLALPQNDFAAIIEEHITRTKNLPLSFARRKEAVLQNLNEYESIDSDEDIDEDTPLKQESLINVREKCLKALALNKAFLREAKVKSIIKDEQRAFADALCIGRLEVSGEQRFLSSDLLELLRFIYGRIRNLNHSSNQLLYLRRQRLYSDHFYMPENKMRMKADKYYGFLRNPHLARNEQCILRPYVKANSLHERYFSHLKGIVMLSCESLVPMALGGADFDGDLAKIVSDHRVVDAIKKGGYTLNKKAYKKELPVIRIPSVKASPEMETGSIPFRTVKNTFSNQIGRISNQAVKIAKKEYGPEGISEEDIKKGKCCAGCTIITGLEIDAAKSGVHPKANISALINGGNNEPDIFLDTKKALKNNTQKYFTPIIEPNKTEYTENSAEAKDTSNAKISEEKLSMFISKNVKEPLLKDVPVYKEDNNVFNIDRLPGEYLSLCKDSNLFKSPSFAAEELPNHKLLFKFQENDNWKSFLEDDKRTKTEKLIEAYKKIQTLARWTNLERKYAEKNKFIGHVNTILKIQYDRIDQKLPCGVTVAEARDQTYATLRVLFEDSMDIIKSLEQLKNTGWQYAPQNQREQIIASVLNIDKEEPVQIPSPVTELLSNFRNSGFMIFYYILKDVQSIFDSNIDADTFIQKEAFKNELKQYMEEENTSKTAKNKKKRPDFSAPKDNPYYQELYDIYSLSSAQKKTDWQLDIAEKCREFMVDLFDGNMNTALQYVYASSGKDSQHKFLWNTFTTAEILTNVFIPES